MAHITGGGLIENLPRVLPEALGASVNLGAWELPPVFKWLATTGRLDVRELARTFNCGVGMVLIVSPADEAAVIEQLRAAGETAFSLGTLTQRGAEVRAATPARRPGRAPSASATVSLPPLR